MKNLSRTFAIVALFFSLSTFSQELTDFSSLLISKELKENANAIVRLSEKTIEIKNVDKLIVKEKRIVTVFNELGKKHIKAYQHYDNDTRITKLTATIFDVFGKKTKKYTKSDFEDVSAVDGGTLYSDARLVYLEHTPTSYPYTVVFESEYKNNNTAFIPKWFPMEGYNVSVEKSTYTLINPLNIEYRKRELNFEGYLIEQSTINSGLIYKLTNQPAIKYESNTIRFNEFTPNLSIALNLFALKGVKGAAKDWNEFGKWMYNSLLRNRNELSPSTKAKANDLVKGIETQEEKIKKIYEFVQNKTRYISVQVDIGGWEPIAANKVDAVGYGDCKGLTNYTKALLDAIGIKSHHVIVFAQGKRDIDKDFTSMQGNHMILNIPNNGNDIWLECTSQTNPFGFLGDFTDDRDVLVVTPDGGIIKRTPSFKEKSLQLIDANIDLKVDGSLNASLSRKSYGIQYDNKFHIENYTPKELDKHYKSYVWDYNNNLELNKTSITNNKDDLEFTEKIELSINEFATVNNTNYLFRVNLLNRTTHIPKRYRKRKRPLKIHRSFIDKDEYTIKLPTGYNISTLPNKKEIKTKFGIYKVTIEKINDRSIIYKREFSLQEGVYPKEDYKPYRKFIKSIAKYDNLRIELIKQ
ncbi:DUF3857 domain-containing protein [Tenacibaculum sp. E3R01]|uniref:DUF3857 domain-containing protein n=1 Tax=Tenacibaculum sp. E3R01 TaxID=2267227 RepID=UPI000DEA56CB|nr:DUF3857 domain-containing protein [Tenacibaculum sp. E3R01]RBW59723.1 DUF3857 domain-containing protein [Tenacibaculum sp. E3R01]